MQRMARFSLKLLQARRADDGCPGSHATIRRLIGNSLAAPPVSCRSSCFQAHNNGWTDRPAICGKSDFLLFSNLEVEIDGATSSAKPAKSGCPRRKEGDRGL